MIQGKRIAWDIDDVCADNATGFAEFCNKTWGLAMTADDFSEDWCAMWDVDIDEVNRRSEIFHTSDAALNYAPHEGAYDTLLALYSGIFDNLKYGDHLKTKVEEYFDVTR
jgi:hypothetical protein